MKVFLAKVLEAYVKFTPAQMIATAVLGVALAGGIPMTVLAWAAVHTSHRTEDTKDSVTDLDAKLAGMRDGLQTQLGAIAQDMRDVKTEIAGLRADVSNVNARTAGHEARLLALEAQRDRFASADGFRSEIRRLDQRIDEVRRELPGRRRDRAGSSNDGEDDAR